MEQVKLQDFCNQISEKIKIDPIQIKKIINTFVDYQLLKKKKKKSK